MKRIGLIFDEYNKADSKKRDKKADSKKRDVDEFAGNENDGGLDDGAEDSPPE